VHPRESGGDRTACYSLPKGVRADPVPPANSQPALVFYDGHCALCHGTVKFLLKHDRTGSAFRFAPLQGPTFQARVPESARATRPDSILVLTPDGALLARSAAFVYILVHLGGIWKPLGGATRAIPRPIRDAAYNFVARVRYRIFGRRSDLCPVVQPSLRCRFDP
jgi:predicted DCC family thiol-disulfide oxidoreductase YuxK